jgi:hypothetical protein
MPLQVGQIVRFNARGVGWATNRRGAPGCGRSVEWNGRVGQVGTISRDKTLVRVQWQAARALATICRPSLLRMGDARQAGDRAGTFLACPRCAVGRTGCCVSQWAARPALKRYVTPLCTSPVLTHRAFCCAASARHAEPPAVATVVRVVRSF